MFHNFDLITVPFLIKPATLLLGSLLGSSFGMVIFRSRRNQAKKELIPETSNDTMIVSAERKHITHSEQSLLPHAWGVINCCRESDQVCASHSAGNAIVL